MNNDQREKLKDLLKTKEQAKNFKIEEILNENGNVDSAKLKESKTANFLIREIGTKFVKDKNGVSQMRSRIKFKGKWYFIDP